MTRTQIATAIPRIGATRTAAITPPRMTVPATPPTSVAFPSAMASITAAMTTDVTAATGAPIPRARPATHASSLEPTAAGASPAPRSARAGTAIAAIAIATVGGRAAASGAISTA